jgi:CelD/BcsL family acetyltransferase involved in cellulose biosynthesis
MLILETHDPRWSHFVTSCRESLPFHHPSWTDLLFDCYGYRAFALAATDGAGEITAGLPVMEVKRPLGKKRWVSLPFTDQCPPLGATVEGMEELMADLDRTRRAAGVSSLEVRAALEGEIAHLQTSAVLHRLRLRPDVGDLFRTFKRSNQRLIHQAERKGVVVERAETMGDLADVFYGLHLQTRRRQGVPVQPRRFFRLLWERVLAPGFGFLLLAYANGVAIAGAVFLAWNGTLSYKFGASDPDFWQLRANNLTMWTAIQWGCTNGYEQFDFGRTDLDNEGLRNFKNSWGAVESPLGYSWIADAPVRVRSHAIQAPVARVIRSSPTWVCRLVGEALYKYAG